ncbi:MAG: succinate dehydrogenase/fumarate reductase iron-sulfur subunit [bacterium]
MEVIIRVRRGGAADDPEGRLRAYTLRTRPRMTVLDALMTIQNGEDPSLAFRHSCRVGMCGTCALRVNGRPRWACRTRLEGLGGTVTLEPLTNFPLLRDLAVDMTPFFEKMKRARAWAEPPEEGAAPLADGASPPEPARISPLSRERRRIEPHIECITCGICYASCTMVGHDPDFLGPAALNRAFTLVCDSREGDAAARLREVGGEHGIWRCHSQFNCTEACPKGISPATAIQGLRRRALASAGRALIASIAGAASPGPENDRPRPPGGEDKEGN